MRAVFNTGPHVFHTRKPSKRHIPASAYYPRLPMKPDEIAAEWTNNVTTAHDRLGMFAHARRDA